MLCSNMRSFRLVFMCVVLFFVKQKTAYEMRISDWSSDVCSSDLVILDHALHFPDRPALVFQDTSVTYGQLNAMVEECAGYLGRMGLGKEIGRASCRARVCQYV